MGIYVVIQNIELIWDNDLNTVQKNDCIKSQQSTKKD